MRAEFGSPEFNAEYQAALLLGNLPRSGKSAKAGSLAWLLSRYRESAAWQSLSLATRRQRENIFVHVLETAGTKPFTAITTATINQALERRAATPAQARHFLDAMRGVFKWALKNNHTRSDPTASVDNPERRTGDGFPAWTEEHVEAYERRWPLGTRQRVWLDVLLYTGLRRGDAVRLGRQHVRAGEIKTEKTGQIVPLQILPVLAKTLAASPTGDLTFIVGERGQPLTKESFGNLFRDAARAAGVPGSAHGCRKLGAVRAANSGASEATLEAIFGWSGGRMASLYTRKANRKRLAKEGMHKLATE
jgi:integrase